MKTVGVARKEPSVRVLMVVERLYELGGAQSQVTRLVRALMNRGIEVKVVTGRWRFSDPHRGELGDGVEVRAIFTAFEMFHIKGLRKFGIYLYILSLMFYLFRNRFRYDIVHVHSATFSGFTAALMGPSLRKPTIMKVMGSGISSDLRRMQEGLIPGSSRMVKCLCRVDRVICLNQKAEMECLSVGFRPEQIVRIANGLPIPEVRHSQSRQVQTFVDAIFVGRLSPEKNPLLILEALSSLQHVPGGEHIRVRFLGTGPQLAELEKNKQEMGLNGKVQLIGRVDNVFSHLRHADIFVLPSLAEGMSNALLEAMAHRLPCIVTEIPGNVELIRHGETGLLVKPNDPLQLAHALIRLAGDAALRERLGRAARAMVEEHFNIDKISDSYVELYRTLLA
jgi:glycosyltransferase involved in cell wall biosynthesis